MIRRLCLLGCSFASLQIWNLFLSDDGSKFVESDVTCQLLQPLSWRCVECAIHHKWDVREE